MSFEFDPTKAQIEKFLTHVLAKMITGIIERRIENVELTEEAPFSGEHNQLYVWGEDD